MSSILETLEIKIPANPKFLKVIRLWVRLTSEVSGFSIEESNNIALGVDEACSNIIKHNYKKSTQQPIQIVCNIYKDRIEFLLRDFGEKANVTEIKSRNLDDIRPGGLGVHLIQSVMDKVVYDSRLEIGNQLQLVKYFNKRNNDAKN
jgi:anti-sigma regulatory factor (Ser/Thr protein kinase)